VFKRKTGSAVKVQGQEVKCQGHSVTLRVQKFAKLFNSSTGIARFRSNFVQTLITWRLMYHELSRSTGQRLRSWRDVMNEHKNAIIQEPISCRRSNLPRIARLRSNLVQSFITSQTANANVTANAQGQNHGVKSQGHSVK